jgi:hypothetical protein
MNDEIRRRRRQAAWFCFQPHLSEDKLVTAIELLEQRFQFDGVNILISYITEVCNQFDIPKDIGKALCVKFFELMAHKSIKLPNDPLPLVEEKRFTAIRQQEQEAAKTQQKQEAIPPIEEIAAHSVIFMCFLKHVIKDSFETHAGLIKLLKLCCENDKKITNTVKAAIESWHQNPESFRWVLVLDVDKLAELTHLLYICLCEAAGPVTADQVFHKAIAICEQRPEAKKFPLSRLL